MSSETTVTLSVPRSAWIRSVLPSQTGRDSAIAEDEPALEALEIFASEAAGIPALAEGSKNPMRINTPSRTLQHKALGATLLLRRQSCIFKYFITVMIGLVQLIYFKSGTGNSREIPEDAQFLI